MAFEVLLIAALATRALDDVKCPERHEHPIAFTDAARNDTLVVTLEGDCTVDGTQVSVQILNEAGAEVFFTTAQSECALSMRDLARFAGGVFSPSTIRREAGELPPADELDEDYSWLLDAEAYERARAQGGTVYCLTTEDFGGQCIWYDAQAGRGIALYGEGS